MEKEQDEKQSVELAVTPKRSLEEKPNPAKSGPDSSAIHEDGKPEYEYITGAKLWLVLASVTLIVFLAMLDMSIIVTAIPRITSDFHSLTDVGWYGSAYLLTSCALQPLTGKIYSQFSSKYTFICFLGLFEAGSVICGAAQSSKMLILGRAVAGLGMSGLSNGALTILADAAPMHKRPAMLGIMMSIGQIGMIAGPLIGGALTQYASWRWCFYINLPIGAVAAILLLIIKIPDRLDRDSTTKPSTIQILKMLDLGGFVLFASFAIMFVLALEWGGTQYPWKSATIIGLFCGAGGMLAIFAAWEYHVGDGAMIPYSIVRRRIIWCSCLVIAFFFGSLFVFSYYLPIYFQAVKGVAPALSGVYILPGILGQMLTATVSGVLVGKLGYYLPWSVGSAVVVSIGAGLISTFTPHSSTAKWVLLQLLAGLGRGCGLQMPIIAIQNALPPEQISVGMALVGFSQSFGGALFLTFAQIIFSHSLVSGLAEYAPTVDAKAVVAAGATLFRQVVKPEQIPGILEAYSKAINHDFYLSAGLAVGMFIFSWGIGWHKVSKKKAVVASEA